MKRKTLISLQCQKPSKKQDFEVNMSSLFHNNPIGTLQERFQGRGLPIPEYEDLPANNGFKIQVKLHDGRTAVGTGINKKEAKKSAALEMLKLLDGVDVRRSPTPASPAHSSASSLDSSLNEGSLGGHSENYIGKLQEYFQTRGGELPTYTVEKQTGPPHNPVFNTRCSVSGHGSTFGSGSNKQVAKAEAAERMWRKVHSSTPTPSGSFSPPRKSESPSSSTSELGDYLSSGEAKSQNGWESPKTFSKGPLSSTLEEIDEDDDDEYRPSVDGSSGASSKYKSDLAFDSFASCPIVKNPVEYVVPWIQQLDRFKMDRTSALYKLKKLNLDQSADDLEGFLLKLSEEVGFTVTFVVKPPKPGSDQFRAIVQMGPNPIATCFGCGPDRGSARKNSILSVLTYIETIAFE